MEDIWASRVQLYNLVWKQPSVVADMYSTKNIKGRLYIISQWKLQEDSIPTNTLCAAAIISIFLPTEKAVESFQVSLVELEGVHVFGLVDSPYQDSRVPVDSRVR